MPSSPPVITVSIDSSSLVKYVWKLHLERLQFHLFPTFSKYIWEVLVPFKMKMKNTVRYGLAKMLISYEMMPDHINSVVLLSTSGKPQPMGSGLPNFLLTPWVTFCACCCSR